MLNRSEISPHPGVANLWVTSLGLGLMVIGFGEPVNADAKPLPATLVAYSSSAPGHGV